MIDGFARFLNKSASGEIHRLNCTCQQRPSYVWVLRVLQVGLF